MMTDGHLADQLADLRAEIARLERREAHLAGLLARAPEASRTGRNARAVVEEQVQRSFDPALLPEEIRNDPRYWREVTTRRVHCEDLPPRALRPGWPIRRTQGRGAGLH